MSKKSTAVQEIAKTRQALTEALGETQLDERYGFVSFIGGALAFAGLFAPVTWIGYGATAAAGIISSMLMKRTAGWFSLRKESRMFETQVVVPFSNAVSDLIAKYELQLYIEEKVNANDIETNGITITQGSSYYQSFHASRGVRYLIGHRYGRPHFVELAVFLGDERNTGTLQQMSAALAMSTLKYAGCLVIEDETNDTKKDGTETVINVTERKVTDVQEFKDLSSLIQWADSIFLKHAEEIKKSTIKRVDTKIPYSDNDLSWWERFAPDVDV